MSEKYMSADNPSVRICLRRENSDKSCTDTNYTANGESGNIHLRWYPHWNDAPVPTAIEPSGSMGVDSTNLAEINFRSLADDNNGDQVATRVIYRQTKDANGAAVSGSWYHFGTTRYDENSVTLNPVTYGSKANNRVSASSPLVYTNAKGWRSTDSSDNIIGDPGNERNHGAVWLSPGTYQYYVKAVDEHRVYSGSVTKSFVVNSAQVTARHISPDSGAKLAPGNIVFKGEGLTILSGNVTAIQAQYKKTDTTTWKTVYFGEADVSCASGTLSSIKANGWRPNVGTSVSDPNGCYVSSGVDIPMPAVSISVPGQYEWHLRALAKTSGGWVYSDWTTSRYFYIISSSAYHYAPENNSTISPGNVVMSGYASGYPSTLDKTAIQVQYRREGGSWSTITSGNEVKCATSVSGSIQLNGWRPNVSDGCFSKKMTPITMPGVSLTTTGRYEWQVRSLVPSDLGGWVYSPWTSSRYFTVSSSVAPTCQLITPRDGAQFNLATESDTSPVAFSATFRDNSGDTINMRIGRKLVGATEWIYNEQTSAIPASGSVTFSPLAASLTRGEYEWMCTATDADGHSSPSVEPWNFSVVYNNPFSCNVVPLTGTGTVPLVVSLQAINGSGEYRFFEILDGDAANLLSTQTNATFNITIRDTALHRYRIENGEESANCPDIQASPSQSPSGGEVAP
jgi:hypothetical protein